MFEKIKDLLMRDMMNLGIVKTISISEDLYCQLSEDQIHYLNGMMECSSRVRWIIVGDKTNHLAFIYTQYPVRSNERETTTDRT